MGSALSINSEYYQHWIFCWVFLGMGLAHLGVTASLTNFGIFSNQAPTDDD